MRILMGLREAPVKGVADILCDARCAGACSCSQHLGEGKVGGLSPGQQVAG